MYSYQSYHIQSIINVVHSMPRTVYLLEVSKQAILVLGFMGISPKFCIRFDAFLLLQHTSGN